jgi:hypothetical protein
LETDNVLLAAPRRVGKTSIMHRLMDEPRGGFKVLFLDGQNHTGPADLVTDLVLRCGELLGDMRGLARKALAHLGNGVEKVELWHLKIELRKQVAANWREQGERAVRETFGAHGKLLLILDELPLLLHKMVSNPQAGKAEAAGLLDWLRYLRTDPSLSRGLRQIVGGSIGLPRIAAYMGASHSINDLHPVEVGPFDRATARQMATALLNSRQVKPDPRTMEAFLDQVGTFLPINIQILASAVADAARLGEAQVTPELIAECYEQRAMGPEFRLCFEDFYERLDRYYPPSEGKAAKRILRELAISSEPVAKSVLLASYQDELGREADPKSFDLLLSWLRDDFYVEELSPQQKLAFKNTWLRDWWRRYHASRG